MATERYAFVAEWLDPNAGVTWRYQLFYYFKTKEVEMVRRSRFLHSGCDHPSMHVWALGDYQQRASTCILPRMQVSVLMIAGALAD